MRWAAVLFFVCSACQSKPVQSPPAEKAATASSAKATPAPTDPAPRELFTQVQQSPRPKDATEKEIITNPGIQTCWLATQGPQTLTLEGQIFSNGHFTKTTAKSADKTLAECVKRALAPISLGKGPKGSYKMQLTTDPMLIPGAKGLILQPPPVKKFQ